MNEPETEVMEEWRRETEVLTKRGSRERQKRMTQLAVWKKQQPAMTHSSSWRLLKTISNQTDTNQSTRVAKKKVPALFSFCAVLAITHPYLSLSLATPYTKTASHWFSWGFKYSVRHRPKGIASKTRKLVVGCLRYPSRTANTGCRPSSRRLLGQAARTESKFSFLAKETILKFFFHLKIKTLFSCNHYYYYYYE